MKDIAALALLQLPAAVAVAGAVFLAYREREGWGWCLFVGCVLAVTRASIN